MLVLTYEKCVKITFNVFQISGTGELTLLDLLINIDTRFSPFYTLAPRLVEGSGAARAAPQLFPRDL